VQPHINNSRTSTNAAAYLTSCTLVLLSGKGNRTTGMYFYCSNGDRQYAGVNSRETRLSDIGP
jgi:hypothetical protein